MSATQVFVVMGDLLHLKCDAWLLPTNVRGGLTKSWLKAHTEIQSLAHASVDSAFREGAKLAAPISAWPPSEPLPILTSVPPDNLWPPSVLLQRIEAFADAALLALGPRPGRTTYPLLAIPFFGTEGGGGGRHLGEMLQDLLAAATQVSEQREADIVIVLQDRAAFALAQKIRRNFGRRAWPSLGHRHLEAARALGEKAKSGTLVPFLGAGISISAGGPSWPQLIERIADVVDPSLLSQPAFSRRSLLDQAGILRQMFEQHATDNSGSFNELVSQHVDVRKYGLAPALLATLPSVGAITLNYDSLFEIACSDAGEARSVIPDNRPEDGDKWLLKLHGSVSNPGSIVLTRDDYIEHTSNRQALSALVKAHLLTHHLLFVGFGLADDHFYEIVHDVRRAIPDEIRGRQSRFGTVLTLFPDTIQEQVWDGQLDFVSVEDSPRSADPSLGVTMPDRETAGRKLEILLDAISAFSTDNHSYLLAPNYPGGLTAEESDLRRDLLALADKPRVDKTSEIWTVLDRAMRELGWNGKGSKSH